MHHPSKDRKHKKRELTSVLSAVESRQSAQELTADRNVRSRHHTTTTNSNNNNNSNNNKHNKTSAHDADDDDEEVVILPNSIVQSVQVIESFNCNLCTDDYKVDSIWYLRCCGKHICFDCMRIQANTCISGYQLPVCPSCSSRTPDKDIRLILAVDELAQYERVTLQKATAQLNLLYCMGVNCKEAVLLEMNEADNPSKWKCRTCKTKHCVSCKGKAHPKITCQQNQEQEKQKKLIELNIGNQKLQACPRCKVIIEKHHGCDHMRCTNCQKDFTWRHKEEEKNKKERE